jgi:hypothetical protein
MTDHHPDYHGGDLTTEHYLMENDNQGLETASALGITNNAGLTHPLKLNEHDSSDYFNEAMELADSREPFDDPLVVDAGNGNDAVALEESSHLLDVEYDHNDGNESELLHDITAATSVNNLDNSGGGDGMSNGLGLLQGGGVTTKTGSSNTVQLSHRHELHERAPADQGHSLVGGLIWSLVLVHVLLLVVLIAAWWRQKRSKDPTMRSLTPGGPPQKVGCSYDMDKSYSLPKIELGNLPIKALKTLKQARA